VTKEGKHPFRALTIAAQIILAGGGVVCLLALFYFLYYYSWTQQRQFESRAGMLLYYVFPATLAFLFFAAARLRPTTKVSLALLVCSVGAPVYFLEGGLTVWQYLPSVVADRQREVIAKSASEAGVAFDDRSRLEVVHDLRNQHVDAVPSIFARAFFQEQKGGTAKSSISAKGGELLPLAGISDKVVVLCNESGQYVTYRSDKHGFNNPQNVWDERPVEIVALGDSAVQGYCVEDNFVNIVRKQHPATLNLGIEGNGPLIMLATLKEYASAVKPKIILWFYYEGNDLPDLTTERKSPLLLRYLSDFSQNLISRQDEIDRALINYVEAIERKSNLGLKLEETWNLLGNAVHVRDVRQLRNSTAGVIRLSQVRQRLGLVYGIENQSRRGINPGTFVPSPERIAWMRSQTDLSYEILSEAKRSVEEWGGKLYFVFLPQYYRYASGFIETPERDAMLNVVKEVGLPVIDIGEGFQSQTDPLSLFPFRRVGHYNDEGNRVVAEEVLRSISAGN